jgi:hypothetical protein
MQACRPLPSPAAAASPLQLRALRPQTAALRRALRCHPSCAWISSAAVYYCCCVINSNRSARFARWSSQRSGSNGVGCLAHFLARYMSNSLARWFPLAPGMLQSPSLTLKCLQTTACSHASIWRRQRTARATEPCSYTCSTGHTASLCLYNTRPSPKPPATTHALRVCAAPTRRIHRPCTASHRQRLRLSTCASKNMYKPQETAPSRKQQHVRRLRRAPAAAAPAQCCPLHEPRPCASIRLLPDATRLCACTHSPRAAQAHAHHGLISSSAWPGATADPFSTSTATTSPLTSACV